MRPVLTVSQFTTIVQTTPKLIFYQFNLLKGFDYASRFLREGGTVLIKRRYMKDLHFLASNKKISKSRRNTSSSAETCFRQTTSCRSLNFPVLQYVYIPKQLLILYDRMSSVIVTWKTNICHKTEACFSFPSRDEQMPRLTIRTLHPPDG